MYFRIKFTLTEGGKAMAKQRGSSREFYWHIRASWRQLNFFSKLAFCISIVSVAAGFTGLLLLIKQTSEDTRLLLIFIVQNILIMFLLTAFAVSTYAKYLVLRKDRSYMNCNRCLEGIMPAWHEMNHDLRSLFSSACETPCNIAATDIHEALKNCCDMLSHILQIYSKKKYEFGALLLAFTSPANAMIIARSGNSRFYTLQFDEYRLMDARPIPVSKDSALQPLLNGYAIWAHNNIKELKTAYHDELMLKECAHAVLSFPVRMAIKGSEKYEIAGFLVVFTLARNSETRNLLSEDNKTPLAMENLIAAFADIMFFIIKRGKAAKPNELSDVNEKYMVDFTNFLFIKELNKFHWHNFYK